MTLNKRIALRIAINGTNLVVGLCLIALIGGTIGGIVGTIYFFGMTELVTDRLV